MKRTIPALALVLPVMLTLTLPLSADVKKEERSQVKLEGMLGTVAGMFGGKAMREGTVSTVALQGQRKATISDTTGEIVDLSEEKVYQLDMKKKTYTVTTFAEIRQQLEEARKKMEEQARKAKEEQAKAEQKQAEEGKPQQEMEVDFDMKETGQHRTIAGYDTREVLMTVTVREKGKTLEEAGGMVLTASNWLGPKIPALQELLDFDIRYARAIAGPEALASAQQMAAAMAMYPMMKDAIARMQKENVNMDGTTLAITSKFDMVASAEQQKQQQQDQASGGGSSAPPTSIGGLLGGFGRKAAKKQEQPPADQAPGRATIMTMNNETLSIATAVSPADVAIPAGFKEKSK